MIWTQNYLCDVHDCDQNSNMRPSAVLRCMQSAAYRQLEKGPLCSEYLKDNSLAFILSRINIEFIENIRVGDEVSVQTCPLDSRGFSFLRSYRISKNGSPAIDCTAVFALKSTKTGALVRVCDVPQLDTGRMQQRFSLSDRFGAPGGEMTPSGRFFVCFSDIDQNRHMNNTRYPDMLCNFIPEMEKKRVRAMSLSFKNEAKQHDEIRLFCAPTDDDALFFKSVLPSGKTNIEALVKCEYID